MHRHRVHQSCINITPHINCQSVISQTLDAQCCINEWSIVTVPIPKLSKNLSIWALSLQSFGQNPVECPTTIQSGLCLQLKQMMSFDCAIVEAQVCWNRTHIHICQLTWMFLLQSMIMRSSLFQFVISTCLNKACFNHQHCIDMHHIGKLACCNADAIQINISIILAVQHWYASVPVRIGWWGDHAYGMVMVLADGETTPMVR